VTYLYGDGAGDRCPETSPETSPALRNGSVALDENVRKLMRQGRVQLDLRAMGKALGSPLYLPRAGVRPERNAQLREIEKAVGADRVWCLDPWKFEQNWPGYFDVLRTLPRRKATSKYIHAVAVDRFNWAWVGCDLHALAGLQLHFLPLLGRGRQPFDYVWSLDWDIGWVGNLPGILDAFSSVSADLLTTTAHAQFTSNSSGYIQFSLRNYLSSQQVYAALLAPARYSRRMLAAMDELVRSGKQAFCETRAVSLCAGQDWCTQHAMRALRPELFVEGYSCCADRGASDLQTAHGAWKAMPASTRPQGQLIHRLRDD